MSSPTGAQRAIPRDSQASARTSDCLSPQQAARQHPTSRADGWTPSRIRTFLDTLAERGVVADAARAAGMSTQGAYAFRNSARGRGFDVAWRAALLLARRRLEDEVMSRALNGCVEVIVRDGEVWGERHRFDNRLTMAVLTRLDAMADSPAQLDDGPRRVAHEFEAFVDSVCAGGDEAVDFLHSRAALPFGAFDEAQIVERNAAYLGARDRGGDVEWEPSPDLPSPEASAPCASTGIPEPNHAASERSVSAPGDGDANSADEAGSEPPNPAPETRELFDRESENRIGAGQGDVEWEPSSSSTSLDLEPLFGSGDPAVSARPPGTRATVAHAHRANRVQPAARIRCCVARNGDAANAGRMSHRLAPTAGAPG
jgi:hypothetical protein